MALFRARPPGELFFWVMLGLVLVYYTFIDTRPLRHRNQTIVKAEQAKQAKQAKQATGKGGDLSQGVVVATDKSPYGDVEAIDYQLGETPASTRSHLAGSHQAPSKHQYVAPFVPPCCTQPTVCLSTTWSWCFLLPLPHWQKARVHCAF